MTEKHDDAGDQDDAELQQEWEFDEGDIIREMHGHTAPGGVPLGKSEYRVKWRLVRPKNGKRCYYVEKSEGDTHLYVAGAVEGMYETITPAESEHFDEVDNDE